MMNKLSSEQVAGVLGQVGPALRAQQQEIVSLQEKVAFYERRDRATKIASDMTRKNLDPELSFEEKVAHLMQPETNLDVLEQAVNMSAQQVKLASLSDHPGTSTDAAAAFEQGILAG